MPTSMLTSLRQTLFATAAAGCAVVLLAGGPAAAATSGATTPSVTTPAGTATGPGAAPSSEAKPMTMAERVNRRIASLHAELQITHAEEPAWHRFTAVMRANAENIDQAMQRRMRLLPTMTAEQNMQSYTHITELHAHDMQKLLPAFEHLYNTMSPSQRQTVDATFRNDADRGKPARNG